MGLQKLESTTTVYYSTPIEARPLSWRRGETRREGKALRFITDGTIGTDSLPREFFNHQLLECDAKNADALAAFVSEWGAPYSPYRFDAHCIYSPPDFEGGRVKHNQLGKKHKAAVEETNPYIDDGWLAYDAISLSEAAATIELLQSFVYLMHDTIRARYDADNSPCAGRSANEERAAHLAQQFRDSARAINAAACHPMQIVANDFLRVDIRQDFPRGLTSAICNQIIEAVNDDVSPWRACKSCGHIFKRKQGGSEKADSDSAYCCKKCADRQRQREYRAKKRKAAQPKGSEHRGKAKGGVDNG